MKYDARIHKQLLMMSDFYCQALWKNISIHDCIHSSQQLYKVIVITSILPMKWRLSWEWR